MDKKIEELRIYTLPITVPHVRALATFSNTAHNDPFDRLIAAQALVENLLLVTSDPAFAGFPHVTVHW